MRSMSRHFAFRFVLLMLAFALVPATAAFAGYWSPKGRVIDSDTGLAAKGVSYAVYAYDPASKDLVCCGSGYVSSSGGFSGHIPDYRPWAIVCFGGGDVYYDQFWGGLHTGFMKTWYAMDSDLDPAVVPLRGDQADAKRLHRESDGTASFGDTWLESVPKPYGLIAGRLLDRITGVGFPGFEFSFWKYDEPSGTWRTVGWNEESKPDGSFTMQGYSGDDLLGGVRLGFNIYTPQGWVTRFYPNVASVDDAITLDLHAGDLLKGLEMPVDIPNRLLGTVMKTESKKPVVQAMVYTSDYDTAAGTWKNESGYEDTSDSGAFCLPGTWSLHPGDYRIRVHDREKDYDDTFYGQATDSDQATTIHLEQGRIIGGLDVWLSNSAAVAGTVLDSTGSRRSDVMVSAFRRGADGAWTDAGSDYTDASGRYRVLVGSAGTYTLRFTDRAGSYDSGDDTTLYLGGAMSATDASTLEVSAHAASVPEPFTLPVAPLPAADRVAASSDTASAIAASKAVFPDGAPAAEPSTLRNLAAGLVPSAASASEAGTATAVLTASGHYPEGLCAAGLAGAVHGPILLTGSSSFCTGLVAELKRLGTVKIYVVGGKTTVPERQLKLLRALGYSVERITGSDRYALSANVARKIASVSTVTSQTPVFVAGGYNTADGFIVAPAAYASHGIVLFTGKKTTPASIVSVVKSLRLRKAYAVGDKRVLPTSALAGLTKAGVRVTRGSTSTSAYTRAASFASVASQRGWLASDKAGLVCLDSLGQSLASTAALGRVRAPLLFVTKASLTSPTASLLKSRAALTDIVHMFSRASTVGTKVLLSAGSY